MIPLTMISPGERVVVKRVSGNAEIKKQLHAMGFAEGNAVTVLTDTHGNRIVKVKESSIALSEALVRHVYVGV